MLAQCKFTRMLSRCMNHVCECVCMYKYVILQTDWLPGCITCVYNTRQHIAYNVLKWANVYSSVSFKMVSKCSEKPPKIVSLTLYLKLFQRLADWWWPSSLVLSRKISSASSFHTSLSLLDMVIGLQTTFISWHQYGHYSVLPYTISYHELNSTRKQHH